MISGNANKRWETGVNKSKLTIADAKFIFDQAEKYFTETTNISQVIVARTTTLISIVSGLLVAMILFVINEIKADTDWSPLLTTAFAGSGYLFWICYLLASNIKSRSYKILGREPKVIFDDRFFVDSIPEDKRILRFYVSEIEAYQEKIDYNRNINENRWRVFNRNLWRIVFTPPILLGVYMISEIVTQILY